MSTMMKAAVVRAFGKPLVIEDVPMPVPGPGEILVKVKACGVCHTDLHAASGDWPVKPAPPFIPGHEAAGVVAALGPGVTDFKLGDAVGVAWLHDACMRCEYCETGWETLCEHQHNTGYSVNGGFAEYVVASAAFAARLPAGVDFAAIAPILCAGVTTYKGLKETEARPGEWVVISGIGGLGHVAVQYAKAMGLKVVAVDIAEDKLKLARAAGADHAVNALSADAVESVLRDTGGGAHGVLVTAVSTAAFAQGCRRANSRRRSSTSCSSGSPCAAQSSARGGTWTKPSPSLWKGRCAAKSPGPRWPTSTRSSTG
jgi:propanol-preferring alcohol dehydrogenase